MNPKRIRLATTVSIISFSTLLLLAVALVLLQTGFRHREFETRTQQMRQEFLEQQKQMIKRETERALDTITYQRLLTEQESRNIVKEKVYEAYAVAGNLFLQNRDRLPEVEIEKMIVDALRQVRFNKGRGYYFITRMNGVGLLFADRPEMEGQDLLPMMDSNGKYVIQDLIQIARHDNEGFYEYQWTKPGTTGSDHRKISFIRYFEPLDCFIGTGLYVQDVEEAIKEEVLQFISTIRFGDDGYIFVNQWDGLGLSGPGQGQNTIDVEDADGLKIVREMIELAKSGGGFLEYRMPSLSSDENRPKISYVLGVKEWEWYVGAGVFADIIESSIHLLENNLKKELTVQLQITLLITLFIILLFMLILFLITRRVGTDINIFFSSLKKAANEDIRIDLDRIHFVETHRIAETANTILQDKIAARQKLQEEKEHLAVTLRAIADGVITVDTKSRILLMNRAAEELTGWTQPEVQGRSLAEVFIDQESEGSQSLESSMQKVLEAGQSIKENLNAVRIPKTGQDYHIENSAAPIRDARGQIRGAVLVFRDVSERVKTEGEKLKLRKLESLGVLAGGIAHDFNNLLTGVFGNMELAKMFLDKDHKSYGFLETAGKAMDNATTLTKQLLTFARGGDPVKEILPLGPLIQETAEFCLRGSRIKLESRMEPGLWMVEADKGQISQVITNLLINAQQAMPDGGIIRITVENVENPQGKFNRISIKDEGIGIPPQYIEKIFDPYFTTKQQGSGLGLASTHSIITKHGGKIKVESELNRGTEFTIYLPALKDTEKAAWEEPSEAAKADAALTARVLVLEDEAIVRNVLEEMLIRLGCSAVFAMDGREAMSLYEEALKTGNPFDLVITDLTIPGGMGGQDAAGEILKIHPQARLIVSSGYATDPVLANYQSYGFKGCVTKPYRLGELERVIRLVCGD